MTEKIQFINAVYVLAMGDTTFHGPSQKSLDRLRLDLERSLVNKKLRKHVMSAIAGFQIAHTTSMTQGHVSAFISELVEGKSDHIIKSIEEDVRQGFAKDPLGFKPWDLYPR